MAVNKIAKYLNQHLVGNVFTKASVLEPYASDTSLLKIPPRYLALPANTKDLQKLVRSANLLAEKRLHLPLTIRGSGLDKTGAAIGPGLVVSTARLNQILEIDERSRLVRVQSGVTLGRLETALALHGLCLPVRQNPGHTIGGLIANYAFSPDGGIYNFVDRLEFVAADGSLVQTARYRRRKTRQLQKLTTFEGKLYRGLPEIIQKYSQLIQRFTAQNIDATGYKMISQLAHGGTFDLMPLLFSSQGTLGVITEVILACEPLPDHSARIAFSFADPKQIPATINSLQKLKPTDLQLYDSQLFTSGKVLDFFSSEPGYILVAKFRGTKFRTHRCLKKAQKFVPTHGNILTETPQNTHLFDAIDDALVNSLNQDTNLEQPPLLDDVRIPLAHLPNFISHLGDLSSELGLPLPLYGSPLSSTYSLRPPVRTTTVLGRKFILRFLREYAALVKTHHGSITGGSPEGRIKGIITNPTLKSNESELYHEIKALFDPYNILNPGVKLGANLSDVVRFMRVGPNSGINPR